MGTCVTKLELHMQIIDRSRPVHVHNISCEACHTISIHMHRLHMRISRGCKSVTSTHLSRPYGMHVSDVTSVTWYNCSGIAVTGVCHSHYASDKMLRFLHQQSSNTTSMYDNHVDEISVRHMTTNREMHSVNAKAHRRLQCLGWAPLVPRRSWTLSVYGSQRLRHFETPLLPTAAPSFPQPCFLQMNQRCTQNNQQLIMKY